MDFVHPAACGRRQLRPHWPRIGMLVFTVAVWGILAAAAVKFFS